MTLTNYYTLFLDQKMPCFCNSPFAVGNQVVVDRQEEDQLLHSQHLAEPLREVKVAIGEAELAVPMDLRGLTAASSCHQPSSNCEANNENCT